MSGPERLPPPWGTEIDRERPLRFTWDGRALTGLAGDTVASALLGAGVRVVGRSFKYHRPRGVVGAGVEEPNAIVDLRLGGRHDPNARATVEALADGMVLRSIHARGTAARDGLAGLDRLARFIPAAFYYKTFLRPGWGLWEGAIRRLAGLGTVDPAARAGRGTEHFATVDVLVVGGGPAGLAAARAALGGGRTVMLVAAGAHLGGALRTSPGGDWAAQGAALAAAGARVLNGAVAFGLYDHNAVAVAQGARLWRVRAGQVILATGAVQQPFAFVDNDRPGVMLVPAVLAYLQRHGVRCGSRVVVATLDGSGAEVAAALARAGAEVTLVDPSLDVAPEGVTLQAGPHLVAALGRGGVEGALLSDGRRIAADLIATGGAWAPALQLYVQAGGRPRWDAGLGAFVPGAPVAGVAVVGAANGTGDLAAALDEASRVGAGGDPSPHPARPRAAPPPTPPGRVWLDLQNDVTTADVALAVREGFTSVEHLKRYTTLGMATDQGKTSALAGVVALGEATGRAPGAVGLTLHRPPYAPVSLATLAGPWRDTALAPPRRLPAEAEHRAERAHFREYGGILRPAWYAGTGAECAAARGAAVVFDASPLGKIEVMGPQAAAFLDFQFYGMISTLAPGRARYGLMLTEGGIVFDDGVVSRLGPEHFVVSCSSSHVAAVVARFEEWRQDRFDLSALHIHDATAAWGTVAVSGPGSRAVLAALGLDVDLPHMALAQSQWDGAPARLVRASFTGERCLEISVPAGRTGALWAAARAAGAVAMGVEALSTLRLEKGYLLVGQDTDGDTMPHDLGLEGPRLRKRVPFVGDRALWTPAACRPGRQQLVGLAAIGPAPLPIGAQVLVDQGAAGFVTSSAVSLALGRPVTLALVQDGRVRLGETVVLRHLGRVREARVVPPCALDPEGGRLDA